MFCASSKACPRWRDLGHIWPVRGRWAVGGRAYGRGVTVDSRTASVAPSGSRRAKWLVLTAVAVTLLLWASAFVAIRHLGRDVPPGALSLGRLLIASVALGVLVFRRPRTWPAQRDWPLLLLCGVGWFSVYNLALNEAERRIDAGTSPPIVKLGPTIVALPPPAFPAKKITRWRLIGM